MSIVKTESLLINQKRLYLLDSINQIKYKTYKICSKKINSIQLLYGIVILILISLKDNAVMSQSINKTDKNDSNNNEKKNSNDIIINSTNSLNTENVFSQNTLFSEIISSNELEEIIRNKKQFFLEVYSPSCFHCRKLASTLEAIIKEYKDANNKDIENTELDFYRMDGSDPSKYRRLLHITYFPTIMVFKNNRFYYHEGVHNSKESIKTFINYIVNYECIEITQHYMNLYLDNIKKRDNDGDSLKNKVNSYFKDLFDDNNKVIISVLETNNDFNNAAAAEIKEDYKAFFDENNSSSFKTLFKKQNNRNKTKNSFGSSSFGIDSQLYSEVEIKDLYDKVITNKETLESLIFKELVYRRIYEIDKCFYINVNKQDNEYETKRKNIALIFNKLEHNNNIGNTDYSDNNANIEISDREFQNKYLNKLIVINRNLNHIENKSLILDNSSITSINKSENGLRISKLDILNNYLSHIKNTKHYNYQETLLLYYYNNNKLNSLKSKSNTNSINNKSTPIHSPETLELQNLTNYHNKEIIKHFKSQLISKFNSFISETNTPFVKYFSNDLSFKYNEVKSIPIIVLAYRSLEDLEFFSEIISLIYSLDLVSDYRVFLFDSSKHTFFSKYNLSGAFNFMIYNLEQNVFLENSESISTESFFKLLDYYNKPTTQSGNRDSNDEYNIIENNGIVDHGKNSGRSDKFVSPIIVESLNNENNSNDSTSSIDSDSNNVTDELANEFLKYQKSKINNSNISSSTNLPPTPPSDEEHVIKEIKNGILSSNSINSKKKNNNSNEEEDTSNLKAMIYLSYLVMYGVVFAFFYSKLNITELEKYS